MFTPGQIGEITDAIHDLDGFDLYKGDDLDSVDTDVLSEIMQAVDAGEPIKDYTEAEWRATED